MKNKRTGQSFCVLLLWVALAVISRPAHAALRLYYNLDSMVYLSSDIVDVELTGEKSGKILLVYKGTTSAGENITVPYVGGGWFKSKAGSRSLQAGDHVTLFLAKTHPVSARPEKDVYTVVPGTRLQYEGREYDFNPIEDDIATDVALLKSEFRKYTPEIGAFQQKLEQSIRFVDAATPVLKGRATFANLPALMDILRNRATHDFEPWDGTDIIQDDACAQIAALHDFNSTADAMVIAGRYYIGEFSPNGYLCAAFISPEGRKFLFRVARDASQSTARRVACVKAMWSAAYGPLTAPAKSSRPVSPPLTAPYRAPEVNEEFIAAMIALLPDVRRSEPVTAAVLALLDSFAHDLKQAAVIERHGAALRKLYAETHAETTRFWLEKVFLNVEGAEAYQALKSDCGPVLSLVRSAEVSADGRSITCVSIRQEIGVNSDAPDHAYDRLPNLVLLNPRIGQRYLLPRVQEMEYSSGWEKRSQEEWALPAGLPPGTYRLFWEFTREDKVISTGHYLEIKL